MVLQSHRKAHRDGLLLAAGLVGLVACLLGGVRFLGGLRGALLRQTRLWVQGVSDGRVL
jgi:hypothetical protein